MWITRNLDGELMLHDYEHANPPTWLGDVGFWSGGITELPTEYFPEVTFENSPMEVEIKLIEK